MRRLALLAALVPLAATPTAGAAVTVITPSSASDPVEVTGTVARDVVTARSLPDGTLRIADPAGVVLVPRAGGGGPACTATATEVVCPAARPVVLLGGGDDTFRAVPGWKGAAPSVRGEAGDDRFEVGGMPAAALDGGPGANTASYVDLAASDGILVDLAGGFTGAGGSIAGVQIVEGSPAGDRLAGGPGAETLRGGAGGDRITGGQGTDDLDGGAGDDLLHAVDGAADRVACGDGRDVADLDAADVDAGGCETRQGPGIVPPGAILAPARPVPVRPTVVRPGRGPFAVVSGPAADNVNAKVGARVRTRAAGLVRLVVRHGEREVGRAEAHAGAADEVTLTVPLDDAVRAAVAATRHAELAVAVEHAGTSGAGPVAEQRQVTLVHPPAFARGRRGISRRGGFGVQRMAGTARGDALRGNSGDDVLRGRGGNDDLHGGTGNDRLVGAAGDDRLDGYDGDDTLLGGSGDDLIVESRFGDDAIDGGPGADWIVGGRGTDRIRGGAGDDVIFGGSAPDAMDCGPGEDTVFINLQSERNGLRGCEHVLEEDDVPSIRCSEGEGTDNGETMLGGEGADVCLGHGGDDDVEGAGGSDRLVGGAGDDRVFGRFGGDELIGEDGDDEIEGGRGEDRLAGGAGGDQLNGGYGRDILDGGAGDDTLIARGGGRDRLDCGPGRDVAYADRADRVTGCESIRRR